MKLSQYAKSVGVGYHTAYRWYQKGLIPGYQMPTGTIIVDVPPDVKEKSTRGLVAIYARVSSTENKANLDAQAERLQNYCAAKGYVVSEIVKEIGSGVNDTRPKLIKLLERPEVTKIVVEHKDRLTRFGFNYIDVLLKQQQKYIEVINEAADEKEDIMQDFISIITSFCARIYGNRRSKRKTEKIIAELNENK
ncbi:MAG: IS607 family transposase [Patescibacteria group bacterium]